MSDSEREQGKDVPDVDEKPTGEQARRLLVTSAVEACLEKFIVHLDVSRGLLTQVSRVSTDPPDSVRQASKSLSGQVRRDLDQRVDSALEMIPELLERAQDGMLAQLPAGKVDMSAVHHPVSTDEVGAVAGYLARTAALDERMAEVFGDHLRDPLAAAYIQARTQEVSRRDLPGRLLGTALLPIVISEFEEFLKALLRVGLRLHPNALGALPDIPRELLSKYGDLADLQRWQLDKKANDTLSGTPEDWRKAIQKWMKLDFADQGASWAAIVEAIQRRHAIVHNGGRADEKYVKVVGPGKVTEGQILACDAGYLRAVFLEFEALALSLSVRWVTKLRHSDRELYPPMVRRVVEHFEAAGQWEKALHILDACLEQSLSDDEREVYQINKWFCLQELGQQDEAMLGSIYGYTPSLAQMKMARAALLRDEPAALQVMREVNAQAKPALLKRQMREDPLFQRFIRENPRIKKALSR